MLVLTIAGRTWSTEGFGPEHNSHNPYESAITAANVDLLTPLRQIPSRTLVTPVIANGTVFGSGSPLSNAPNFISAQPVSGCGTNPGCGWTASLECAPYCLAPASLSVSGGTVYATKDALLAFDAATGALRWRADNVRDLPPPSIAGGRVYAPADDGSVVVFDAAGREGCSGAPVVCAPMFSAAAPDGYYAYQTSVAAGVLYATFLDSGVSSMKLVAFDATGRQGCTGTPTTCAPLWTAHLPPGTGRIAVDGGRVFTSGRPDGSTKANLFAFDAAGQQGCAFTPRVCAPLWRATMPSSVDSIAAAAGRVFVKASTGVVLAFDATGTGSACSGTPVICSAAWQTPPAFYSPGGLTVAGGVLFTRISGFGVAGFDASGQRGCSGTPKICDPLVSKGGDAAMVGDPVVLGGVVYLATRDDGILEYALPGP